jgi:hypothetical protein
VKKYDKPFENDIEKYRENPQDSEGEEEEEEKSGKFTYLCNLYRNLYSKIL